MSFAGALQMRCIFHVTTQPCAVHRKSRDVGNRDRGFKPLTDVDPTSSTAITYVDQSGG